MSRSKAKAIIWDMDGVIVDTAPYHLKAWQEAELVVDTLEAVGVRDLERLFSPS